MVELSQGGNTGVPLSPFAVTVQWSPAMIQGSEVDVSAFLLASTGKVRNDQDFVFYGATASICGSVRLSAAPSAARFDVDLARVPAAVERIAFTATVGAGASFGAAQSLVLTIEGVARFSVATAGMTEAAVIVGELYRRGDAWKIRAVGQGFNGGLAPLATHMGVVVDDEPAAPAPVPAPAAPVSAPVVVPVIAPVVVPVIAPVTPPKPAAKVRLEKSAISLEKSAPQLISLAKTAQVSLEKKGLIDHTAAVTLCMDVSGSMYGMFKDGTVQAIIERVLALGLNFDDNGAIDVFAFGTTAQYIGELAGADFAKAAERISKEEKCGGGTNYAPAIEAVLAHHRLSGAAPAPPSGGGGGGLLSRILGAKVSLNRPPAPASGTSAKHPVYVLFVTDGDNADHDATRAAMIRAANYPVFFQFVGIGPLSFAFLDEIDKMRGRRVDNASFFKVPNPKKIPEATLYDKMMSEYPAWLTAARREGLLR